MDRPFMTWQHKDILLDEKDKEIERLKVIYKRQEDAINEEVKKVVLKDHETVHLNTENEQLETCNEGLRIQGKDFIKEIEQLRKERDFWKSAVRTELEENESGDGVENEMYEHERALQQALKEE